MADFCKECNNELFGLNESDWKFDPTIPLEPGEGFLVLCETCGPILVDHNGLRLPVDAPGDKLKESK